jgi:hypothetical protein
VRIDGSSRGTGDSPTRAAVPPSGFSLSVSRRGLAESRPPPAPAKADEAPLALSGAPPGREGPNPLLPPPPPADEEDGDEVLEAKAESASSPLPSFESSATVIGGFESPARKARPPPRPHPSSAGSELRLPRSDTWPNLAASRCASLSGNANSDSGIGVRAFVATSASPAAARHAFADILCEKMLSHTRRMPVIATLRCF